MVVSHPFVLLRDRYQRNFHHFIAKIWSSMSIAPFIRLKIQGSENLPPKDSPAVYVSNHQSFLDIYTLLRLGRNFKFISKTAIFLYPIVGWAMFLMGTIPLKRMDRKSQLQTLKRCMELVKNGGSVFFFPVRMVVWALSRKVRSVLLPKWEYQWFRLLLWELVKLCL